MLIMESCAALIGDVVASREHPDQSGLLRTLAAELGRVRDELAPDSGLAPTVGDEFQARFDDLWQAIRVSARIRTALGRHGIDVRIGLGVGRVEVADADLLPAGQSGSAWWRAREAIEAAAQDAGRSQWPRTLRTVVVAEEEPGPVTAHLLCLDELFGRLDERDFAVLEGLMTGRRQVDVAAELGISQSAVTQRQHDHGCQQVGGADPGPGLAHLVVDELIEIDVVLSAR